jgi:hypothetical protein
MKALNSGEPMHDVQLASACENLCGLTAKRRGAKHNSRSVPARSGFEGIDCISEALKIFLRMVHADVNVHGEPRVAIDDGGKATDNDVIHVLGFQPTKDLD